MNRVIQSLLSMLLVFVVIGIASAAGDAAIGKEKSATCGACHGADGNSLVGAWPSIAGQNERYLVKQMLAFKKGKSEGGRYDPNMTPLMQALSKDDMENLAAYFASQKPKLGVADKKLVAKGEQLYRGGDLTRHISACIACHGPRGLGNAPAGYPLIRGQHPQYTIKQLKAYRSGERTTGAMMLAIAKNMTDKDIQAVASYIAGLH